jgi:hypothetical protein
MVKPVRRRATPLVVLLTVILATACVGSGKTARTESLEPLPDGLSVVSDITMGCREGESGFDYRFLVIGKTNDLSPSGPLQVSLLNHGFYHSILIPDDLPWVSIGYQNAKYPLRAEIGLLSRYLNRPLPYQGPNPESLPLEVRAQADQYLLIAMRPTDFACATPL